MSVFCGLTPPHVLGYQYDLEVPRHLWRCPITVKKLPSILQWILGDRFEHLVLAPPVPEFMYPEQDL